MGTFDSADIIVNINRFNLHRNRRTDRLLISSFRIVLRLTVVRILSVDLSVGQIRERLVLLGFVGK